MKRICFPCTSPIHLARNQLLLNELKENFEIHIAEYSQKDMSMSEIMVDIVPKFKKALDVIKPDAVLARGDRFEIAPLALLSFYNRIPIIHIEGGATSGDNVVDSKIRNVVSWLSSYHLVTDETARKNLITMGLPIDNIFNVGSFDVHYAKQVKTHKLFDEDYILVLHHSLPEENTELVLEAVREATNLKVVGTRGNNDYMKSIMNEEYSPEDFISLLKYAKCFISNSSAACKEASILGVPTCLLGHRQDGRLIGHNAIRVPHKKEEIIKMTRLQINHGEYEPDLVYYKENSPQLACDIIKKMI